MAESIYQTGVIDAGDGNVGARSAFIDVRSVNGNARVVVKAPAGWSSAAVALKTALLDAEGGAQYLDDLSTAQSFTADTDAEMVDVSMEAFLVFEVTTQSSSQSVPIHWMVYAVDA